VRSLPLAQVNVYAQVAADAEVTDWGAIDRPAIALVEARCARCSLGRPHRRSAGRVERFGVLEAW